MKCAFIVVEQQTLQQVEAVFDRDALLIRLITKIDELCKAGVTDFFTNLKYGVNLWCAEIVASFKQDNPDIKLHAVLYRNQPLHPDDDIYRWRYDDALKACDSRIYLQEKSAEPPVVLLDVHMITLADIILVVNPRGTARARSGLNDLLGCADTTQKQILHL